MHLDVALERTLLGSKLNIMTDVTLLREEVEPGQSRLVQFGGHHTNQACYKSGIMSPEYPE